MAAERLNQVFLASFQADGHAVHLAVNLLVNIHQADGLGLRVEHLRSTAQFQILDQDDTIAVGEHIALF
jgi:hypothetical protein